MMRLSHDEQSKLVEDHAVLARSMANRFKGMGVDRDDLEQEILIGLWEATRTYDPVKYPGVPFFAHARTYAIRRCAQAIARAGEVPLRISQARAQCRHAEAQLECDGHATPTVEQVAKATGYQLIDVEFALALPRTTSLGSHDPADAKEDRHLERAIDELWAAMDILSPSDRKLLEQLHGLNGQVNLELFELSRRHGISVSQLKRRIDSIRQRLKLELLRRGFKPGRSKVPVVAQLSALS